ncbi:MAG: biotin transporter BioY [Pseudomonadota bacterium]
MPNATATEINPVSSPLKLHQRSLLWQIIAVLAGTLALTLSSYLEVPMIPVPMTMQTYAVVLIGALFGWRLGTITVLAWLAQAAIGLPVLSGGSGGPLVFIGPTAGYLFAFPLASAIVGWLAQNGWNGQRIGLAFVAMLLGHALCLFLGGLWLATLIGFEPAIAAGVTPFLLGAVFKSALAAATLKMLHREPAPPSDS